MDDETDLQRRAPLSVHGDVREAVEHGRQEERPHVHQGPDAYGPPPDRVQPEVIIAPSVQVRPQGATLREIVPSAMGHGDEHEAGGSNRVKKQSKNEIEERGHGKTSLGGKVVTFLSSTSRHDFDYDTKYIFTFTLILDRSL